MYLDQSKRKIENPTSHRKHNMTLVKVHSELLNFVLAQTNTARKCLEGR
ncbi:MAG: hypothetical protein ACI83B_003341 [Sediminicola sp.]|jgi:hypothetical protein